MKRVHKVLNGELPYVEQEDDSEVDLARPDVVNPATEHLQPTQQLSLENYHKGSGALH